MWLGAVNIFSQGTSSKKFVPHRNLPPAWTPVRHFDDAADQHLNYGLSVVFRAPQLAAGASKQGAPYTATPAKRAYQRFFRIVRANKKGRLAAAILCFVQAATACAFRFLRQPNRPIAPRPVAKSGSAAGSGVAVGVKV
jgi:hypothetical protein